MCDDSEGLNSVLIRQACRGQLMNGAHCDGAQSFGLEEVVRKVRQVPDARVGVRATEVSIPPRLNEITTFAKAKRDLCRLGSRGESELKGRAVIRHCATVLWHADRCVPVSPNAGSPGRNRRRVGCRSHRTWAYPGLRCARRWPDPDRCGLQLLVRSARERADRSPGPTLPRSD
jgi:hypothetical protein